MSENLNLPGWLEEVESELKNNILGFWKARTIDNTNGGFIGAMNADGEIEEGADKSLVLNARILWTFAAAYRKYGQEEDLHMAERALEQLEAYFVDNEFGGFYWMIHPDGTPSEDKKQVYGQAFVIYALAEYIRATDNHEPLQLAEEIYRLLERYAYDPVHTGYVEALSREWSETDDLSLSGKDLNERKSMNTHLHVLEAYTNLYRIWKPEGLRLKLKELIEVHLKLILNMESGHFKLFFDDEWNSQSTDVSYGHDIEGSWLLWEAAEVLGDRELLNQVRSAALKMAVATLEEGTDEDGAIYNELHADGRLDDSKDWWPQAEAMVGYLNAYQISEETRYLHAAQRSWNFIRDYIVDRTGGEWHWQVFRSGEPNLSQQKVGAWKCPYHNSRACLEAIERLESITRSYSQV